jgi:hypothetical protein
VKFNLTTITMLAALLLSSSAFAQQRTAKQPAPDRVAAFVAVKGEPDYEPQSFKFSASGYQYTIFSNGRGRRSGGEFPPDTNRPLSELQSTDSATNTPITTKKTICRFAILLVKNLSMYARIL